MHFRKLFDSKYIGSWDLEGRDHTVTITSVKGDTVEGEKGRKDKKGVIGLGEFPKPFLCNVTNAKTIAGIYGADTTAWKGKRITLYATTTRSADGETVPCIRVRPTAPKASAKGREAPHPADPIRVASTAEELVAALGACAAWIGEDHTERWPAVLRRCAELGVTEEQATEAVARGPA